MSKYGQRATILCLISVFFFPFVFKKFLGIGRHSYLTVAFHKNSLQHVNYICSPWNYTDTSIIAQHAQSHVTIIIS